jgi:hypothetical protein
MQYLSQADYDSFWKDGFFICRSVFSSKEIEDYRAHAMQVTDFVPDLLANPHLRQLITDDRVVTIAADLLGSVPTFIGDGVLTCKPKPSNWHKDNPGRYNSSTLDWQSNYPIIRFGIYLQDHSTHSGGVSVRRMSHNSPSRFGGKPVYADTAIGDMVIWHGRTTHRASTSLLRVIGTPVFAYKIDKRLPKFLKIKNDRDRYAVFFTYGAQGPELDHFVNYYATRQHAVDRAAATVYDENWIRSLYPAKVIIRDTRESVQSLPPEQVAVQHREF